MQKLVLLARQPSTVAGISALCGTLAALVLHQLTLAQAIPLVVGSLASIILPDNSAARQAAQTLAQEVLASDGVK